MMTLTRRYHLLICALFAGGSALGLPPEAAIKLQNEFTVRYREMANDPVFGKASSLLPYAYAAEKPGDGKAFLYVPDHVGPEARVILFLHGYGGLFQLFPYYLSRSFPDAILICPAYGISTAFIPAAYLRECRNAVAEHLKIRLLLEVWVKERLP